MKLHLITRLVSIIILLGLLVSMAGPVNASFVFHSLSPVQQDSPADNEQPDAPDRPLETEMFQQAIPEGILAITAGGWHTCVLTGAYNINCWGSNGYGQLGDGTNTLRTTPVKVKGLVGNINTVVAGDNHTCVLTSGGEVQCWGNNGYGQLGDGTNADRSTPTVITNGIKAITAGEYHTCALTNAGGVKCWGFNDYGQLGDGTTTNRNTPVAVSGLSSGITALAAGRRHTCALNTSGGVSCWGENGSGELGNGTNNNSSTPVTVSGLSGATALEAGSFHNCALVSGGEVKCWGYNGSGDLGDGTYTNRSTPVTVSGLSGDITALAAGWYHTCAITTSGSMKCWGWGQFGQLGNGINGSRKTPGAVSLGSWGSVTKLAAGGGHTCAVTTAGEAICWGYNVDGQIGDGTTTDRYSPVKVAVPTKCSGTTTTPNPILLVPGWSGSKNSLADDENLRYFGGWKEGQHVGQGYLEKKNYIEGCNLFYAEATSPYLNQAENGAVIRNNICTAALEVKKYYPNWSGHMDIIAHSYGGLRARAYLENPDYYPYSCAGLTQFQVKVDHLITMGSPHGGELPELPLSYLIGLYGSVTANLPAIKEMLPSVRENENRNSSQPSGVTYYLISGDARSQGSFPLWPFPTVRNDPNDFAVHRSSAHTLGGMVQFPKTELLYTNDTHGVAGAPVSWLYSSESYVNGPTFDRCIWPIIEKGANQCAGGAGQQVKPTNSQPEAESVLDYVTGLSAAQATGDASLYDVQMGTLANSDVINGTFELNNPGKTQVILGWSSGNVGFILKDPDGNTLTPTDAGVTSSSFDTGFGWMTSYELDTAKTGTWSYTITANALPDPVGYRLAVIPPLPVSVSASAPTWLPNASPVTLTAAVKYAGTTPLMGGSVTAQINKPDGASENLALLDDGAHDDGAANDGVFGTIYNPTNLGGMYGVILTAEGTYGGEVYKRTTITNFSIAPNNASLGSQYGDQSVDGEPNSPRLYEWLQISVPVTVSQASTYTVSADIYAGSTYIASAKKQIALEPGEQTVFLRFEGEKIFRAKTDGPYELRNVMLFDETDVTVLIQAADHVYTTFAYPYQDFGYDEIFLPAITR